MDNNLFSLFDDNVTPEETNSKSKASKTPKKKSKANNTTNSNLFLFEADTTANEATDTLDEELAPIPAENELQEITSSEPITDDQITSAPITNEDEIPSATIQEEITATNIIQEETETDDVIVVNDANKEEATIAGQEAIEEENIHENDVDETKEDEIHEPSLEEEIATSINEASIQEVVIEQEEVENTVAQFSLPKNDLINQNNQAIADIDTHLLGEIIATDYSMFLEHEQEVMSLQKPAQESEATEWTGQEETSEQVEPETPSLPEWDLSKKYYTIGEVAQLFEVNTSHIRFWSKEFNLRLRTTRKGDRLYTPEDIEKLRWIHELVKVKKHTIKGAKELLQTQKQKVVEKVALKENLKELKSLLLGIQKKL